MARPRAAWSSLSRASLGCRCGTWASARRPATFCPSTRKISWSRSLLDRTIAVNASPDERFMAHALELARRGIALAAPNPRVGAVVVDASGEIIGEGFHAYDGVKHAELLALEQAGEAARDAPLSLPL